MIKLQIRKQDDDGWIGPLGGGTLGEEGWREPTTEELTTVDTFYAIILDEPLGHTKKWYEVGVMWGSPSDILCHCVETFPTAEVLRLEWTYPPTLEEVSNLSEADLELIQVQIIKKKEED
jgi:hypothetical protein